MASSLRLSFVLFLASLFLHAALGNVYIYVCMLWFSCLVVRPVQGVRANGYLHFLFLFLIFGSLFCSWDWVRVFAKECLCIFNCVFWEEVFAGDLHDQRRKPRIFVQDIGRCCWKNGGLHWDRSMRESLWCW